MSESPVSLKQPVFKRSERAKRGANHAQKRLLVLNNLAERLPGADEFSLTLDREKLPLRKSTIRVLQINLGKMCNLECRHCHVEAGPQRKEIISSELIKRLLRLTEKFGFSVVDLTGGAPEMCPGFKDYVQAFRHLGCEVIVRSNLTILLEPGFEEYPEFMAQNGVHIIASLPCYSEANVDAQRGEGVFLASIEALKRLNALGYGTEGSRLELDLVFNPGKATLPGPQQALEQAYKERLAEDFGITFNRLLTITNLPIGRFYSDLKKQGAADAYDRLLRENFNPATVSHLMCRDTLNISWDGWVYDCDFNQMIELPMTAGGGAALHVTDLLQLEQFEDLPIATGNHCFGCTAGSGSSCTGVLV